MQKGEVVDFIVQVVLSPAVFLHQSPPPVDTSQEALLLPNHPDQMNINQAVSPTLRNLVLLVPAAVEVITVEIKARSFQYRYLYHGAHTITMEEVLEHHFYLEALF